TFDIVIGRTFNPTDPYWFTGSMDELALFNKVLSDSEVLSVYNYLWGASGGDSASFARGIVQGFSICENATISIDSLLAVNDTSAGHTETWSLAMPPAHGTAAVAYSATSTGSTLVP